MVRKVMLAGLLCLLGLLLAACGRERPTPPARNVFYEVYTTAPGTAGHDASPQRAPASSLGIELADKPILTPDFQATWSINWLCMSDRCAFETCTGTAHSKVRGMVGERWLEIDRRVDWNEGCGQRTSWLSQVDQFTGEERYPSRQDKLFNFWAGARAGAPDRTIEIGDGRKVNVWCTGPQQAEVEEDDGWTTLYDGEVCYDVATGMLIHMSYIKRWVFTGEFQGQEYERAYFGDSETYEQLLETTNAGLDFVVNE
ncbi:MAG: hypothetical protein D6790_11915 [Caldilineae bacterium]|nr:MAG: hypothetical protein D6790_11915 [Caldilineae bacterium]